MNARESLAADRVAEEAWRNADEIREVHGAGELCASMALIAIAAELRAARVYANYLEGRQGARSRGKATQLREPGS